MKPKSLITSMLHTPSPTYTEVAKLPKIYCLSLHINAVLTDNIKTWVQMCLIAGQKIRIISQSFCVSNSVFIVYLVPSSELTRIFCVSRCWPEVIFFCVSLFYHNCETDYWWIISMKQYCNILLSTYVSFCSGFVTAIKSGKQAIWASFLPFATPVGFNTRCF